MTVGILTYHRAHNYGGVLQCYALTQAIKSFGVNVEVIDYQCDFFLEQYKKYSWKNLPKLKKLASIILHNGNVKYNGDNFEDFVTQNLPVSTMKYSRSNISSANGKYSTFISGSDQVWSPYCSGFDKTYFLDFVDNSSKKSAYAASFGVDTLPIEIEPEFTRLLSEFNNVSLREHTGNDIFYKLTGRNEKVVLDPTLLLTKLDWLSVTNEKFAKRKYVLVYMIAESKQTLSLAKSIAEKEGLEVVYISDRIFTDRSVTTLSRVSVSDWVSLFKDAEYVITNSFHGIAFSINFSKNFYVQFLPGKAKTNTRISTILETFGLSDRLIDSKQDTINPEAVSSYDVIQSKLEVLRERSKSVLHDVVKSEVNFSER
ncbi:polysaccharide pyruvyl transferase family protein [Vibrio alginolyticus]|uniref:polysaccharide pyruvyl transferase family protein n=1 Tax=Vibrio alginolyticus TaxID=663 RepID=UPI0037543541